MGKWQTNWCKLSAVAMSTKILKMVQSLQLGNFTSIIWGQENKYMWIFAMGQSHLVSQTS